MKKKFWYNEGLDSACPHAAPVLIPMMIEGKPK